MAKKNNKKQRGKRRAAHKNPSRIKAVRPNKSDNIDHQASGVADSLTPDSSPLESPDNQEVPIEPPVSASSAANMDSTNETIPNHPDAKSFSPENADAQDEDDTDNVMTNGAENEVEKGADIEPVEDTASDDRADLDMSANATGMKSLDTDSMAESDQTRPNGEMPEDNSAPDSLDTDSMAESDQTGSNGEMPEDTPAQNSLDTDSMAESDKIEPNGEMPEDTPVPASLDTDETAEPSETETETVPKTDISEAEAGIDNSAEGDLNLATKSRQHDLLIEASNIGKRFALQQAQFGEQTNQAPEQEPKQPNTEQQATEPSPPKRGSMIRTMAESVTKVFKRSGSSNNSSSPADPAIPAISEQSNSLEILRGLDLKVTHGDTVAIVGVSGSGKSTLLSLLAGLDIPDEGSIYIDGEDITLLSETERSILRAKKMAFVFQDFMLLPHLTALENVLLPLEMKAKTNARDRATAELEKVGLGDRKNHFPSQLSGGEQQRTALARAFASEPLLLFADEPSGNLDGATGQQISDLLFDLNLSSETTLVVVTHDMNLAARCSKIYELNQGTLSTKTLNKDIER